MLDIGLNLINLTDEYKRRDTAGALSASLLIGAGVMALIPATAVYAIPIGIVGSIIARFKLSDLELWLKHGPFSAGGTSTTGDTYTNKVRPHRVAGQSRLCRVYVVDNVQFFVDPSTKALLDVEDYSAGYSRFTYDPNTKTVSHQDGTTPSRTVVARVGDRFEIDRVALCVTDIEGRFAGHSPGTDPKEHTVKRHGQRQFYDPNPDQIPIYRYARWCEHPEEAYLALQDALYRPSVQVNAHTKGSSAFIIETRFRLPIFIPAKSCLRFDYQIMDDKGGVIHELCIDGHGADQLQPLKDYQDKKEPNLYTLTYQVPQHQLHTVTARARLDLKGDKSMAVPWEPVFDKGVKTEEEALWAYDSASASSATAT